MKKLLTLLAFFVASCSPLPAQNTLAGNLTVQQSVKFTGDITPPQLTADVDDYAPASFSAATFLRVAADAPRVITGLAGGADGRIVWLSNIGGYPISLAHAFTGSAAANRFDLGGANYELAAGNGLGLWYDATAARWRPLSGLAAGGGGGGTGTVTSVAVTTANGVSAAVANPTTSPTLTFSLGAITPSSVAATGNVTGANLTGTNTGDQSDATLTFSDVTTNNVSTMRHGFAPKLPNDAAKYLDGTGAWSTPAGGGGSGTVTSVSVVSANGVSGSVANASTTPAITLSIGAIAPTSVAATGTVTGSNLSGTNTGDQTSVTGNAGTATALQTARTINGVSFNGTANITIPAVDQTARDAASAAQTTANAAETPTGAQTKATAAQAYSIQRANHTGTQAATTITADATHRFVTDTEKSTWDGKVSFPGFGTTGTTAAVGNDSRLSDARTPLAHNQAWSTITSTPTTLTGYGVTDAQPLDSDLTSIAALTTTTFGRSLLTQADAAATRTTIGAGTSSFDGTYASLTGIPSTFTPAAHNQAWSTITSTPTTLSGYGISDAQGLDADLTALAGLSSNGLIARTADGAAATRTITGTANQVIVTNGDGAAGNPTLSLPQSIATTSTPLFAEVGVNGAAASFRLLQFYTGGVLRINVGTDGAGESGANAGSNFQINRFDDAGNWLGAALFIKRSTGNVGIGNPNPLRKLDVVGDAGGNGIRVTGTTGTIGAFTAEGTSVNIQADSAAATRVLVDAGSSNASGFVALNGGSSGYVQIGTGGTARMQVFASGIVKLNNYGAGTLVTDSSGNVTASSDSSLKTVTGPFIRGLADVLKLTPRTYRWNEKSGMDTEDENVGFIAQEVLDAVPEAVGQYRTSEVEVDGKKTKKREKAELLTLSDRPLIAALVNAVKELKAENDALSARIAKLEGKK